MHACHIAKITSTKTELNVIMDLGLKITYGFTSVDLAATTPPSLLDVDLPVMLVLWQKWSNN